MATVLKPPTYLIVLSLVSLALGCDRGGRKETPQQTVDRTEIQDAETVPEADGGPDASRAGPKAPPTESDALRAGPEKAARIGSIRVIVQSATVGKVSLKKFRGSSESKDDVLIVRLELTNVSPTKKIEYRTWAGDDFALLDHDFASIRDNFGNTYKRITFGFGAAPEGAVEGSEAIYPNDKLADVLVFEKPVKNAAYLDLDLPAKNFGSTGTLKFRLPAATTFRPTPKQGPSNGANRTGPPEDDTPLDLDLPPGKPLPKVDPADPRDLFVRNAQRAKRMAEKMKSDFDRQDGPSLRASQLADAAAKWEEEAQRYKTGIRLFKEKALKDAKAELQKEAEAKFPSSKTDLKVRAKAEAQQAKFVADGMQEVRARIAKEYALD